MRGYVLPIVLALLLAAPMLWRMEGEVEVEQMTGARVVFQEVQPEQAVDLSSEAAADSELLQVVPLLPAADHALSGDALAPTVLPASALSGEAR